MNELREKAKRAKELTTELGLKTTEEKNAALLSMAQQLVKEQSFILAENEKDQAAGRQNGLNDGLIDRLSLTEARIADMAEGLKQVAQLNDPIGEELEQFTRPNGLTIRKVRVPLGVIGMVYEARPNVTVDASSLCLKAGNAVLLRGSSSAIHSNKAIVAVLHRALEKTTIPTAAIQLIEDTSRETAAELFKLNEFVDVLIPRGGSGLIQTVVQNATIPVLETGVGNCHIYIDESANKEMALSIAVNAKTQRPSVCNAAETILVHQTWANKHLNELVAILNEKNVQIYSDALLKNMFPQFQLATESDWADEYLDYKVALKVVPTVDEAIRHISKYGTYHSEAIISETSENVEAFLNQVDAAAVYHNASTRFTDGFEFGFGAEIGISTQKLHARGPMGLEALTSTKFHVLGNGQIKK
ncbi:gamma-glutamyl phosphate reductase [Alkalihalobacillus alcalophilus ATCC 27647 = CGMCC 1.3604]|uniref:Gamma-glutamyl phosphate reductase n=1 Tax=Alkalihalobacillus alcalophilus ATCC 27647 = CGMCC 1.3604 TaxID=1218173 RepID=A0A094YUB6_ALKAL|nr:glutamate-5-semialdehyde dehydrogenase [Alkalihalobacillus alcalophilus]KGA97092.1 gamma-glutamyl phosphate reductase [Alkalihalobacillus alcalophilus ATCC 27647 = CGMCC 1.3604]MED1563062.1 glutamate-5-semialdehyde dehydrogenase [Alkalihalobacillus alcalophilus]THG88993.1 gamma-glutamyl phosphate reductase [Alkalihalobacillus alcalophilus ATCC 27647 = CGMCC 1.3604]